MLPSTFPFPVQERAWHVEGLPRSAKGLPLPVTWRLVLY